MTCYETMFAAERVAKREVEDTHIPKVIWVTPDNMFEVRDRILTMDQYHPRKGEMVISVIFPITR